ncbi:MAG: dephospho-CoA kinase [Nitrososphaeraceae archaeon]|nr:dephospho-CoA kinase [Nitrososphaeraceae archaeon]
MGHSGLKHILKIGLTGGIGSGKSTICKFFNELGVPVIDADEIAHELVEPEKPAFKKIIKSLGNQYVTEEGKLDRKKLRNDIFTNDKLKKKLETILHPLIFEEIENRISLLNYPYCVVSIPLLIETDAQDKVDRILVVDIPEEIQIDRARIRDETDRIKIIKIIKTQEKRSKRLDVADEIIKNDGNIEELREQVTELHKNYLKIAGSYQNDK